MPQNATPCLCGQTAMTPAMDSAGRIHTPGQCGCFESGTRPPMPCYIPITAGPDEAKRNIRNAYPMQAFVIVDASNGLHKRRATPAEAEAFWAGQTNTRCVRGDFCWSHPVKLSESEMVEHDTGPGEQHWPVRP